MELLSGFDAEKNLLRKRSGALSNREVRSCLINECNFTSVSGCPIDDSSVSAEPSAR